MEKYFKYPKTPHFPFSREIEVDDITLKDIPFIGKDVVVSIKMDGECSGLYRDHFHARSLDSRMHISRTWIASLHATIKNEIPDGWRIYGENVYATHSLHYVDLPTYFFVFGIYNEKNECMSWDETEEICKMLSLTTVPVLYRGIWDLVEINRRFAAFKDFSAYDIITKEKEQEGWVCRIAEKFHYDDFQKSVSKNVRHKHIKSDDHWMDNAVVPNELRKNDKI